MHNGFLQVEGEKMSKSLGNFVTISDLLRYDQPSAGAKWSGEALRLAMLRTHYRQPIDWTVRALEEAESTLDRWYEAVGDAEPGPDVAPDVLDALADDLNTPAAISELYKLAHGPADRRREPGSSRQAPISSVFCSETQNRAGGLRRSEDAAIDTAPWKA